MLGGNGSKALNTFVTFSVVLLVFAATSCRSDSHSRLPHTPFAEFQKLHNDRTSANVRVVGILDLKSICLNFKPHYKPNGDPCKAYFSESGRGGDVPTEEVSLRVCNDRISTNCIDPLPVNAPPEVVVIRDSAGNEIERWSRVVIEAKLNAADKLTGIEVVKIDDAG